MATPPPVAPRHPIRETDRGVRDTTKPISALCRVSYQITDRGGKLGAYIGVGLPKVFLRSPATAFLGERDDFSNSSASSMTVLPSALPVIEDMDSSFSSLALWWSVMGARDARMGLQQNQGLLSSKGKQYLGFAGEEELQEATMASRSETEGSFPFDIYLQ